jgi:orotidine-5'-phosphate decarboxylase
MNNMDRLHEAVLKKGNVCVGLDTSAEYIPEAAMKLFSTDAEAVLAYNKALVDRTLDVAACYKTQIAYYESLGLAGMAAYAMTLAYIRERGGIVIADIKRGDIADTAVRYAAAHFSGDFEADFVTLNPYMGRDSLEPWLYAAEKTGKGAFVLVRTSNPGMNDLENRELKTGGRLYDEAARMVSGLAALYRGDYGYGGFGAVMGCTDANDAAAIRLEYNSLFFLIPGYGAQGGSADTAALLLKPDGTGGVVNASRSILTAWRSCPQCMTLEAAADEARRAVLDMRDTISAACRCRAKGRC